MSGGKGGGQTVQTSSQTSSDPWAAQQPYLRDLFSRAQGLYGAPSPYLEQATQARATEAGPNSLTGQAAGQFGKTISGDYLNADTNPYLKGAVNDVMNQVQGRVAGTFGTRGGNNYGSSAHQEWLGRSLADAALPIYAQNYATERGRQLNAAELAPTLSNARIGNLDLAGNSPWNQLQRYQSAVGGNYGGTSSTLGTQPYYGGDPLANALGLGIGGVGLYGMGKNAGLWGGGVAGGLAGLGGDFFGSAGMGDLAYLALA